MNIYQQPGSLNLIGWQLEMGVASKFIQYDKGYDDLTGGTATGILLICSIFPGGIVQNA